MITGQIGYSNVQLWGNSGNVLSTSMTLQIPTATGVNVYLNVNHQFIGPNGTGFTLNADLFRNNVANLGIAHSTDTPTKTYILNVPLGVAGASSYITAISGAYTGAPWSGFLPYNWTISYAQFAAALTFMQNTYGSTLFPSILPSDWPLTLLHINAEFHFTPVTAECTLGWSAQNWNVNLSSGASSTVYSIPINVAVTETLEALATTPGLTNSAVASALYTIAAPAATPTFSPLSLRHKLNLLIFAGEESESVH